MIPSTNTEMAEGNPIPVDQEHQPGPAPVQVSAVQMTTVC